MRTITVAANGDYEFENIYTHIPSVIVAQILTNGTFDGTITFEKKAQNSALARVPALYIDDLLKVVSNAVVAGANKNLIVIVDSSGSNVFAKVTGWTTGSAQIDYVVLQDTFPAFKVASGGGSPTADVNVISALPPGNNNIGDVDIVTMPAIVLGAGTNNIGDVDVLSLPALSLAPSANNIGDVDVLTLPDVNLSAGTLAALETISIASLPAISGTVELGATSLAALETIQVGSIVPIALDATTLAALESITIGTALPAGNNNIGDVDVLTLPSLPAGGNNIGIVDLSAAALAALETIQIGSLPDVNLSAGTLAALETITIGTALPAGGNNIGDVDVLTLPAISLGASANNIGDVDIASSVPLALDATTLAALETIELGATTLAALENIKVDKQPLTGSAPVNVSVGVASASALAANGARKGLVLTNLSANLISFGINNAAVLNKGISLNANGGVWVMDEFTYSIQEIFAIAAGAGSILAIQELT